VTARGCTRRRPTAAAASAWPCRRERRPRGARRGSLGARSSSARRRGSLSRASSPGGSLARTRWDPASPSSRGAAEPLTMATGGSDKRPPSTPAPRSPSPPGPARSQPRVGRSSPPYGLGIPLIYVFPFIPIIGIP
jgi:hypothetical protein